MTWMTPRRRPGRREETGGEEHSARHPLRWEAIAILTFPPQIGLDGGRLKTRPKL
jgi:hypothetical protein